MRITAVAVLLFSFFCHRAHGQGGPPDWYMQNLEDQDGTWVTDNSSYQSDNEPFEAYALEWKPGPLKNTLFGRLYGIIDGKDVASFWEFHQYYSRITGAVVVLQIGHDHAIGEGALEYVSETRLELVQEFIFSDGTQRVEKHLYELTAPDTQVTTSLTQEGNTWVRNRTYTWIRER